MTHPPTFLVQQSPAEQEPETPVAAATVPPVVAVERTPSIGTRVARYLRSGGARGDFSYYLSLVLVLLAVAWFLSHALFTVPLGTVGVRTGFGSSAGQALDPGPYVVVPKLSEMLLYSTEEIEYPVQISGLKDAAGLPLASAEVMVVYRVMRSAVDQAIALEFSPAQNANGIRLPLANKMVRDIPRILGAFVGKLDVAQLAVLGPQLGPLVQDELQQELNAWLPKGVQVVSITVPPILEYTEPEPVASEPAGPQTVAPSEASAAEPEPAAPADAAQPSSVPAAPQGAAEVPQPPGPVPGAIGVKAADSSVKGKLPEADAGFGG
ncbi:SPFH domain-containing protein [Sinimarinibacterium sp. CAU 1509]|uniref:SPFH domain-containing protein n=1 Tax=Sinimarinibacterium sp. CAU 1509 TaxID=2562283 RepID=UPI00146B0467|nr:SPFH domain-containing protein [Sinimarinibacterium sp. CAU 1509]